MIRDPDVREKSQRTVLRVEQGGVPTRMLAVAKLTPVVHVGDRVSVSGTLELPKPFDTEDGRIFVADHHDGLLVFDPATVKDMANYENPDRYSQGIDWVLVNGKAVVAQGGEGLMLRRPGHCYEYGRSNAWLKVKPAHVD